MDKLRSAVDAPLRGQEHGEDETPVLPMEAAQMAAMERKIKCTLPRLDASRASEVASALETVMSWSTAADGWLRAPGAFTLVRKLVDLFYHKEKVVHVAGGALMVLITQTRAGVNMLLFPSRFDKTVVDKEAYNKSQMQDFLGVMFLLMQQTTGVPKGRAVVHSMMRTLASMLQVPETKAHLAAFPDFPNLLDRLLNLHGTCLYDVELTMLSGRLCKQFVKEMPEFILGHSRFISVIMEFTREIKRGYQSMSESMDSDDMAELQNRRLQHAAAVRAAEEAKEDLVQKMAKAEQYMLYVKKHEESDLVEERRKAMHYQELIQEALRDAEEAASLLLIKEKKAERILKGENKIDQDKVVAAMVSGEDAAVMLEEIMSTYQGRMLVLSNHSNLHMLFEVVAQALTKGEGMGGDACEAIMGYLTHSADAARWLVQVGSAMDERDERSRLTKMDLVPVISAMLLSGEVRAQRVSLRALVSLFGAAMYMEPLHPEGEAVAMILPRLRNCLLSDDIPLAMYAVRLINHLTDLSEDAAGRRALLVGGGDGEETQAVDQFLCAVTMLLNDTDDESHLSHLTVLLCTFLCTPEAFDTLERVLDASPIPPAPKAPSMWETWFGYTPEEPEASEVGNAADNNRLSGLMRRALVKALLSEVHTASMAAAEAIAHLAETEQFRHWLMSGRGETAPSILLQKMIGFAVAEPPVLKDKTKKAEAAAEAAQTAVEAEVVEQEQEKADEPPVVVQPTSPATPPTDDEVVGSLVQGIMDKTTGKTSENAKLKAESLAAMKAINVDALRSKAPGFVQSTALVAVKAPSDPKAVQINRTAMLNSWVATENKPQPLKSDFGPAPVDQDEGDNLVWSGSNWIIHGASGVIGQVLKQLVYDELMLERLQRLDTKVKVAHIVLHSLVQLATLTKVGETGAKHAADALEHITKKRYGLMYMSVLGEEGIVELVQAMRQAEAQITNAAIKQKVLGALTRLEDAQPKK